MSWRNPSTSQYFAWISELSQCDFKIEHRKGNNHTNADNLSRLEHEDSCRQCNLQPNIELNIKAASKDCGKAVKTRKILKTATESKIKLAIIPRKIIIIIFFSQEKRDDRLKTRDNCV